MAKPADVERGIAQLVARLPQYDKYQKYYLGDHDTKFASDAYRKSFGKMIKRLQYNRCSTVVDAFADRLQIASWQDEAAVSAKDRESQAAVDAWREIRGNELAGMVHAEHIKMGDAYLIVWPDEDDPMRPRWRMQQAERCGMVYDEETAEPLYGFKLWPSEDKETAVPWRLTIYADDVVTRWISSGNVQSLDNLKPDMFKPYGVDGPAEIANEYDTLPMFHFRNNPEHQTAYGRSELADVVGMQDAINYALWSLLVAMEFVAWPQKVAIGVDRLGDDDEELDTAVDRWLTIGNQLANVFAIPGAPLEPFTVTINEIDGLIARVTGIPVHWMGMASVSLHNISGETVKALEAPFVSQISDRMHGLNAPWSSSMEFDQRIRGEGTGKEATSALIPLWKSPETRSDMETWTIAQLKRNAGVPDSQLWKEGGYSQEQVDAFLEENQRIADEEAERFAKQFASGQADGFGNDEADDDENDGE